MAGRTAGDAAGDASGGGSADGGEGEVRRAVRIERAAYALLLRDCRRLLRAVRAGEAEASQAGAAAGGDMDGAGNGSVSGEAAAASQARGAEAEAIHLLQATARDDARRLPRVAAD